jgi:autotransporter-associated beta strand protein
VLKTGTGTLILSGTNTFSGYIQVQAGGILSVPSISNALGSVSSIILGGSSGSGTLLYTGTGEDTDRVIAYSASYSAGCNQIIDSSGTGLLRFTNDFNMYGTKDHTNYFQGTGSGEVAASITNGGITTVIKNGAGTWTFSGSNGFTGGFILNAGQLNINSTNALGTGKFTIAAASTIDNTSGSDLTLFNNNAQAWNADFTFAGTGNLDLGSGAVTLSANRQVAVNANKLAVGGAISGAYSLTKTGNGTLALSGTSTYTGNTIISAGTLALAGSGSISSSPILSVASGATLDVSGLSTAFALGASQTLSNSASATGTLTGDVNTGSGKLAVSFVDGTPSFTVASGTLTLSDATTVTINNTGAALAVGSTYKIIAKSGTGAVAGTVPTSVSVVNAQIACTAALSVVDGELYLNITPATSSITYSATGPFTYDGAIHSPTASITGSTGTQTSEYIGVSVTYGPSTIAPVNAGTYLLSNTVAADASYLGATNTQDFTIAPAALSITANSTSKVFGQAITFAGTEFIATGLIGSDSVTSVTLASTGAASTAPVNTYPIVASAAVGTGLGNYTLTYHDGTLTVTAASNPSVKGIEIKDGSAIITFKGIENVGYVTQSASDVNGPWADISTNIAPVSGEWSVTNSVDKKDIQFYRTYIPAGVEP